MRYIREKTKHLKRLSASFHEGFVSTYFLSILLYLTALLSVVTINDQRRLETVMNMQENDAYFLQEAAVVSDIRCRLVNDRLSEGSFAAEGYSYDLDIKKNRIYAEIRSTRPETLNIICDFEEKVLLDLTCVRSYQKH